MATTFELESLTTTKAVVSFACMGEPRRRWTVDMRNPGPPGAIKARANNGETCSLGMFRIDHSTPHPGYMKLRNAVAKVWNKKKVKA